MTWKMYDINSQKIFTFISSPASFFSFVYGGFQSWILSSLRQLVSFAIKYFFCAILLKQKHTWKGKEKKTNNPLIQLSCSRIFCFSRSQSDILEFCNKWWVLNAFHAFWWGEEIEAKLWEKMGDKYWKEGEIWTGAGITYKGPVIWRPIKPLPIPSCELGLQKVSIYQN